jgi:hypothetical protein
MNKRPRKTSPFLAQISLTRSIVFGRSRYVLFWSVLRLYPLYAYRRETIELLFQRIIQACDLKACPTRGLARTGTFVIASMWLYQVLFLDHYRHPRPLAHIKEIIDEGRWRLAA